MTALLRLRLSGRALSSLGLLMAAVLLSIGAPAWGSHGSDGVVRTGVVTGDPAPAGGERVMSPTGPGAADFGLLPHHVRPLLGAVAMIALPRGSQPYWVLILALGLYLSRVPDRNSLQRLVGGCRNGTRAPPLHS